MTTDPTRRSALLALAMAGVVLLGACASDPGTPAQQRQRRVEHRLEASFSRQQAACIVKGIDASTIAALDRGATLTPDSAQLRTYTNAVTLCTASGSGFATSTTTPTTSSTTTGN